VIGAMGLGLAFGGLGPVAGSAKLIPVPVQVHSGPGWGVPAADKSAVYYLTRDHRLVSVDQASGRVRWVGRLASDGETTAGSLVLVDESVVVAGDFDLFAFDRVTGVRRWRFSPSGGYGVGMYVGAIDEGVVFTGSPTGRIYAIETTDGRLRWKTDALGEKVTVFAPRPVAGGVAAGYTDFGASGRAGGVALVDSGDGRLKWRTSFPSSSEQSVRFGGGPVAVDDLVVAASSDGTIYALDHRSGDVRWTVAPESLEPGGAGVLTAEDYRPMTLSGRTLVIGSLSGSLMAIDVDSHRERWRRAIIEEGSVAFRIHSDRQSVYAPYASGKVVAVGVMDGQERWRAGTRETRFDWPPALSDDRIFLTSKDGLYVLPRSIR
jgi:outer membrane protein assembly factor BamB